MGEFADQQESKLESKLSEVELTQQMIGLAHSYQVSTLLDFWTEMLINTLSASNLAARVLLAEQFDLANLKVRP